MMLQPKMLRTDIAKLFMKSESHFGAPLIFFVGQSKKPTPYPSMNGLGNIVMPMKKKVAVRRHPSARAARRPGRRLRRFLGLLLEHFGFCGVEAPAAVGACWVRIARCGRVAVREAGSVWCVGGSRALRAEASGPDGADARR